MNEAEIECPFCGRMNEYDTDNDTLLCDECSELIIIEEVEKAHGKARPRMPQVQGGRE